MIIFIGDKINDELKINFLLANLCFIPLFLIHFSLQFDAFLGTHTSDAKKEPNYLMIAKVRLPIEEAITDISEY